MELIHVIRISLYCEAALIFGLPAAAWAVGGQSLLARWRAIPLIAALLCVPISIFGFLVALSEMAGSNLGALDRGLILTLLTGSTLGLTMIVRCVSALICAALLANKSFSLAALSGAFVASSLAWLGHGGSGEGLPGYVRLGGDIAHILAASAWLGALALFLLALFTREERDLGAEPSIGSLLAGFAMPGSLIVGVLILTGLSNMLFIAPPSSWMEILGDPYGEALLVKLALFCLMLGLAAINRFALVPRLTTPASLKKKVIYTIRFTIFFEAMAGLAILALVAWLGFLDPYGR